MEHSATPIVLARWSARRRGLLFLLSGNMLLDAIEVSTASVALPSIGNDLHLPLGSVQWVMSGFALGFGGLLLFGGRVVTLLGRRRVYIVAVLVFAVASVLGGLTNDGMLLTATRFVKGVCAALTAPTGLSIISTAFAEGPDRNKAVSIYTLAGASGFSVGLLLSGLLTTYLGWRWTFLVPAGFAVVLFVFALQLIPRDGHGADAGRYDFTAAVSFAGAMLLVAYAVATAPRHGWAPTLGVFALAAVLLAVFVLIERSARHPLVRFGLLKHPPLLRSILGAASLNGSHLGLHLVGTFFFQSLLRWTPLQTALAFLPASLPLLLSAPFSGIMVKRFGAAKLIAVGAVAPLVGYTVLLLSLSPAPNYVANILPAMLLVGTGFVLSFSALNIQVTTTIPTCDKGMAIGLYQTAVQLGAVLVLVLVAALLTAARVPGGGQINAVLANYRLALSLIAAVGAFGLLVGITAVFPQRWLPALGSRLN